MAAKYTEMVDHRTKPVSDQDGTVIVDPGCGWGLGCCAVVVVVLGLVALGLFKLILSFGRGF